MSNTKKQITAHKLANTDRAVEDLELTPLHYRLLALMVKLAIGETGICRRAQTDLAKRLGLHPRTVQRGLDHLVDHNYLEPIGEARKGFIQAYRVFRPQEVTSAPYLEPEATSAAEHTALVSPHTAPASRSYGGRAVHVPLASPLLFPSADPETAPDGPRSRAERPLGPPPEAEASKRLGKGGVVLAPEPKPPAPARSPNRLGPLGDKLEQRLGETVYRAWFEAGGVELISQDAETIRFGCKSSFYATYLGNKFGLDIGRLAGVDRVDFEVRTPAPPELRQAAE